jgi:uncharacterized protein (TIGR02145 family)
MNLLFRNILIVLLIFINIQQSYSQQTKKVTLDKKQRKIDSLAQVDRYKTQQIEKLNLEIKRLQANLNAPKSKDQTTVSKEKTNELENKVAIQQLQIKKQQEELEALRIKIRTLQNQLNTKGASKGNIAGGSTANDASTYTLKIGSQTWMTTNLNVTHFRNGDLIKEAKTDEEWNECARKKIPAWCYFHNDEANDRKTGKLYNWYAVNDPRGIAPEGYHVPTEDDWKKLVNQLGGEEVAAPKMRYGKQWGDSILVMSPKGNFGATPSGWRKFTEEKVEFLNEGAYWWCATALSLKFAWTRYLLFHSKEVKSYCYNKGSGLAVRCLKD